MAVRRIDPSTIAGESPEAVDLFIESDFRIRSGQCPNGCGALTPAEFGQECGVCKFATNVIPDREAMS